MFTLKFDYNGDTRRATVPEDSKPEFESLEKHIRELYRESIPQDRAIKLKYLDDEGDAISVSCDHDLREAFLFRALTGRSTLRFDVIPIEPLGKMPGSDSPSNDAGASATQEWSDKVRGRFKGIVDACQKIGVMLQKKLEEKRLAQAAKLLEAAQEAEKEAAVVQEEKEATTPKAEEEVVAAQDTKQAEEVAAQEKEDQSTTPVQPEEQLEQQMKEVEKEKEKEMLEEPEIDFKPRQDQPHNMNAEVVVIPAPRMSDEWREMLKMYELTVEEMAELNRRLQPHKRK